MTLPMAARARYNLVSGALIRTMDVWGGVLHMYNLRAGAKSGPRRPCDLQGKKLNTAAAGGGLEDILTLPVTSCALYHVFLGIPLEVTHVPRGVSQRCNFRASSKLVFRPPPDSQAGGLETTAPGGARGRFPYPPHDFPRRLKCIPGTLLRSTHVPRGVLHTYIFRSSAKLAFRRPRDSQVRGFETATPGWGRRGFPNPPYGLPRPLRSFSGTPLRSTHVIRGVL